MKSAIYKIGKVCIEIHMPEEMLMPENMSLFQVSEEQDVAMRYFLDYTENVVAMAQELLEQRISGKEAVRNNIHVFQTKAGECRVMNFIGHPLPYVITLSDGSTTRVWFQKEIAHMLKYDTVFVSALSLEKLMLDAGAMIFHSAYMNYKDRAVLFSAPSETGKSTQANLWETYRGTYTVNGDRSLLIRENDGWYAYGWPICGSSEICRNEVYPIRAIVMLKQARVNRAYPLKGFQALREVMEQIMINTWDADFQMKVMDKLEELLTEVPVYRLECDISEDAVRCLEELIG